MSRHDQRQQQGQAGHTPAAPLHSETDRATVRVELLRLAHRHDHNAEQIVERARILESYVYGEPAADKA